MKKTTITPIQLTIEEKGHINRQVYGLLVNNPSNEEHDFKEFSYVVRSPTHLAHCVRAHTSFQKPEYELVRYMPEEVKRVYERKYDVTRVVTELTDEEFSQFTKTLDGLL